MSTLLLSGIALSLSAAQVAYAALDARCLIHVFDSLQQTVHDGYELRPENEATVGRMPAESK